MDDRRNVDDQHFYDDSSAALGLGYSYRDIRSAKPGDPAIAPALTRDEIEERDRRAREYQQFIAPIAEAELAAAQGPEPARDPHGNVIPSNTGAYADFEQRTRALLSQGFGASEASSIALDGTVLEATEAPVQRDVIGASIESIMHRKVKKGGSSKGGRTGEKMFPKRCRNKDCHLQYCDHPKPGGARKRGRPPTGRTEKIRARVSTQAKSGFQGRNVSEEMDILGIALATGKTYEQVRRERKGAA